MGKLSLADQLRESVDFDRGEGGQRQDFHFPNHSGMLYVEGALEWMGDNAVKIGIMWGAHSDAMIFSNDTALTVFADGTKYLESVDDFPRSMIRSGPSVCIWAHKNGVKISRK